MKKISHSIICPFICLMTIMMVMQGCASDQFEDVREKDDTFPRLSVTAALAGQTYTRANQDEDEGRVVDGRYYLSYPATDNVYTVAIVDFDKQKTETEGLGIVSSLDGEELAWNKIGGSPVDFYLDNVGNEYGSSSLVTFNDDNPFVAGLFDFENGSNDLLWGEKSVYRNTKTLNFDLHHCMSRIRVQVQVAKSDQSVDDITLDDATVEITNLYTTPRTYNRLDGVLSPADDAETASVVVVSYDEEYEKYGWESISTSEENSDITYLSQDIVILPQSLAEDVNRPQLKITLSNGKVYSGILPHAMLIANSETDNSLNYPVTLAFLREHILTIRTLITEEPPQLAFMPVWVTDWVDKGEFTLEAHQSGVYTASEFSKLIGYYQDHNEYQLVRYGYLFTPEGTDTQKWLFNIFSSVVLQFDDIYNKMKPQTVVGEKGKTKDFEFVFNNYAVYIEKEGESEMTQVTESQLYAIVTGNPNWEQIR